MRVIASANQKGGCGKTTTAINLSSSLSSKGERVLLIDFDPQAHATMGLNIMHSDLEKSIYHVITPKDYKFLRIEDILVPIKDNFDLAPSSLILSAVEQELSGLEGRENRLFRAIQALKKTYDYVVIDCPPSIGHLCFNALRACQEVIIPIDMSLFSLRGVAKLLEFIILLKDKTGHDVKSRALITMYDRRTRYSRVVLEKVKTEFGDNVFETVIRYNIRLRETADHGLPVGDYDKTAIGHKDYENLAEEVIRLEADRMYPDLNTLSMTEDILQKTEEYIDMSVKSPELEQPTSEMEEFSTYSPQSNYSEMVEAIATGSTNSFFNDEDR
ncbi:MAG: chromosome partitioning protein [Desulfobacteraceae bacterium Eth-SRB2]|nr:MAG: chromosome partitioning protein [Desulfobacteraceae bacterium Eth-SRB2]